MCVSSSVALFAGTKGYIGSVNHPKHGFIHVLGYQNKVLNLHTSPNAMILPFPTSNEMGAENIIELGLYKNILNQMVEMFNPRPRTFMTKGMSLSNSASYVKVFQSGIYHVILASNPSLVLAALEQVPEEKRPTIKPELMEWYTWQYPEHAIAICCFNNKEQAEADPLFWWYTPKHKDAPLFFPAVDSHSGKLPNLLSQVYVDHALVLGLEDSPSGTTNPFKQTPVIGEFLNSRLRGFQFKGELPNGDFFVLNGSLQRHVNLEAPFKKGTPLDLTPQP